MYENHHKQLSNLLNEIQERTNKVNKHLKSKHSADWAEQATERENDDVLLELSREGQKELQLIKRALARIEAGEYGDCEKCGDQINPERLEAMPMANLCINCANKNDKR